MKKGISVIGVPMWLGQSRYGTNLGPDALRSAGVISQLTTLHDDVIDEGNIAIAGSIPSRKQDKRLRNCRPVASACIRLANSMSKVFSQGRFPLVLGGDHSIAIGSLAAAAQHVASLGVIWYDAHTDINTAETTPSGNIHGMPLAAALGLGHPTLTEIGGRRPKVKAENIVFIGARDIDPGEAALIAAKKIKVYTVDEIHRRGMDAVMREAAAYLAARCDGIHLSFDLDGLDPAEAPGVGTPVENGISFSDSLAAVEVLKQSGLVTSAEFVELNPLLDKNNDTSRAAVRLITALCGVGTTDVPAKPAVVDRVLRENLI